MRQHSTLLDLFADQHQDNALRARIRELQAARDHRAAQQRLLADFKVPVDEWTARIENLEAGQGGEPCATA